MLAVDDDGGNLTVFNNGIPAAVLAVDDDGGILGIFNNEKPAVRLAADDDGGGLSIYNKTGETIINMHPDEYGNGRIGVWNRKGKGRVYDSQP